jgi:hypothetical protein
VLGGSVVPREKVAAIEIGFGFEFAALERRDPEISAEKRESGEELDERRMLRVETVVARLVHHVAGEDVVVFVEGKRLTMDDVGNLHGLNDKEGKHCCPSPSF